MSIKMYKGNTIEISGKKKVSLKINGQKVEVSTNKGICYSSLAYGEFAEPIELARSIIDSNLASDMPEIEAFDTLTNVSAESLDVRKNLADLSESERNNYRDALFLLKERGEYDKYIKFHGFTSNLGHSGPAFFAWHRVFLRKFEQELQQTDSKFTNVTLPYWDYTSSNTDEQNRSKIWRDDFLGKNGNVNLTWTGEDGLLKKWILPGYEALNGTIIERDGIVRRNFPLTSRAVTPLTFNQSLRSNDYRNFGNPQHPRGFEGGPHGGAHVYLGTGNGDQGSFATAVNDPFFMFLHCNVDRMWAKWQQLMKQRWLQANPSQDYPSTQLAEDYYWDESDRAHTWGGEGDSGSQSATNRHNLEDIFWPWDATETHNGGAKSKFIDEQDKEIYTPLRVLNHESLVYEYDNLDPTGFSI